MGRQSARGLVLALMRVKSTLPYEVWVSNYQGVLSTCDGATRGYMRFNARFGTVARAITERDWYHKHGYYVELRNGDA